MRKIILLYIISFVLFSCSQYPNEVKPTLEQAGDNKKELEKVLDFYKTNTKDSLKYKAAIFLIKNMIYHQSFKQIKEFEKAFDSIEKYPKNDLRIEVFEKILDSVSKKINPNIQIIADSKCVTSKYLIKNIELSFWAWNKIEKKKRASFNDFCNYILPYKNSDEPIEFDTRERLIKKYSWVYKELENGASFHTIVDSVCKDFGHKYMGEIRKYYPVPLSVGYIEKSRLGLCDDGVNYLVNVFRSLGIFCAKDMLPHWGNHHSSGHSWIYLKYGSEEYHKDITENIDLKIKYKGESLPKVYRITYNKQEEFSEFGKDVTSEYVPTVNITIENVLNSDYTQPVLCVFDKSKEWVPITTGTYDNKKQVYKNIGINVPYMAANLKNNRIIPVNYPFFINNNKTIHFYKPTRFFLDSVPLVRKSGLSSPKNRSKIFWIRNLNWGVFQGANHLNFENAKTLDDINFNTTHLKKVKLKQFENFKYVRFHAKLNDCFLAKLAFYGSDGKELKGDVFIENNKFLQLEIGAFDNDPLTFSGGKNFTLGLKFKKPMQIHSIEYQVRNDGNHINIGDEYELFYWNKEWKTLGKQIAKDTVLYYKTPSNALLWLKDNSNGIEENVFITGKDKKQHWLGYDNYKR